jgi:O-antigen ligase
MMIYRLIVIDIFLLVIYNCTYTLNLSRIVLNGFSAAILLNTLILFGLDPYGFSQEGIGRFSGTVANSNIFANMMISGVLILFYERWVLSDRSFLNLTLILLGVINIFATGSRAALAIVSILGIFILIKLNKGRFSKSLLVIGFFVLLMLMYTLYQSDVLGEFGDNLTSRILNFISLLSGDTGARSDQYRLLFLQKAFDSFRQNALWGIGLGGLTGAIGHYAHNNFFELLADVGLIGTLVYYFIFYSMYMKVKSIPELPKEIVSFTALVIILRCLLDLTIVSYYLRAILIFIIYLEAMIDSRKNKAF